MLPGDQHKLGVSTPSAQEEQHISPYTAAQIATLQAKLEKQLGPEFISSRKGAKGMKVHYLAGDKSINLANEVFGFNGWSSSIRNVEVDFLDRVGEDKWNCAVTVTMRVTLKDGTYHEDIGCGNMDKGTKAAVFQKAKKEAVTDAVKRCLRNFGNVLGNCIYDKQFLDKIVKVKTPVIRFDEKKLHRHKDFAHLGQRDNLLVPRQEPQTPLTLESSEKNVPADGEEESSEPYDEYGDDEFDELGIFEGGDDAFDIVADNGSADKTKQQTTVTSQDSPKIDTKPLQLQQAPRPPVASPQNQLQQQQQPQYARPNQPQQFQTRPQQPTQNPQQRPPVVRPTSAPQGPRMVSQTRQNQPVTPNRAPTPVNNIQRPQQRDGQIPQPPQPIPIIAAPQLQDTPFEPVPHAPPVGFLSGKAALHLNQEKKEIPTTPDKEHAFNPHHQTTLRRSAGIDHSKSSPIPRKHFPVNQDNAAAAAATSRLNFENPSIGTTRQIGAPPGPTPGRTAFRAPSMVGVKRPAEGAPVASALNDAPKVQGNWQGQNNGSNDTKRMKS